MSGPKRYEVTGHWRKLHNEDFHIFYSSENNIITQIKQRIIRWAGHVVSIGESKKGTKIWWKSPEERDHLEAQGVDRRTVLEWILGRLARDVEWTQLPYYRHWFLSTDMVYYLFPLKKEVTNFMKQRPS
jgi:hypothetical protein